MFIKLGKIRFGEKRATSLIELIITITIFSAVAVISTIALINTMQSTKRIQSQVFLYTEAQALMDQLARTVERNTIDYEAYYDRYVQGSEYWSTQDTYGYYAQAFYDPGSDGPTTDGPYDGVEYYDAECPSDPLLIYPDDCASETPVYSELDLDTGQHPFDGIIGFTGDYETGEEDANALCREDAGGSTDCSEWGWAFVDELILINGDGDERTVFLQESFDADLEDFYLSKIQFSGTDSDEDGIVDDWECMSEYSCAEAYGPDVSDLTDEDGDQVDFMPITPSAISIEEFYVILTPVENPFLAFAEEAVQVQPYVTIIMTVELSDEYSGGFLGDTLSITIQRTVSTGVYSEVVSYE